MRPHEAAFSYSICSSVSKTTFLAREQVGSLLAMSTAATTSQAVKAAVRKPRGRPPLPPRHGPRPSTLAPAFRPVSPSLLVAKQGNGYNLFVPQLRKLIFEYCERSEQSERARAYLLKHVEDVAHANPHVEVVVKTRTLKPPIVRGLYCMLSASTVVLILTSPKS
jgi:hypothetical protein